MAVVVEPKPDSEAGELVIREIGNRRKQNIVRRMLVVLVLADDLGRQSLDELGSQGDDGGDQEPQLDRAKCGWRALSDADERRDTGLIVGASREGCGEGTAPQSEGRTTKKGSCVAQLPERLQLAATVLFSHCFLGAVV